MSFVNTVELIGDEALANSIIDRSITEIADNITKSIGNHAFWQCATLKKADFRAATSVGIASFSGCTSLESVNLPAVTSVSRSVFIQCPFRTLDLPAVTSIGANALDKCKKLAALILRNTTMCKLEGDIGTTTFNYYTRDGYIYVPRALLSDDNASKDYRRATNWSKYANQFRALEDYTVDGTTTGALDTTKI